MISTKLAVKAFYCRSAGHCRVAHILVFMAGHYEGMESVPWPQP